MKHKIIIVILIILVVGCERPTPPPDGPIIEQSIIDELLEKTIAIDSFQFFYNITGLNEKRYYYMLGPDIKVAFPTIKHLEDGTPYDTVYMEREKKIAYTYCSKKSCPEKDPYAEPINFSLYNIDTPREKVFILNKAELVREELYKERYYVEVINFTNTDGDNGLMWVQSYYGVPLKLEYLDKEGNKKTLVYENISWDSVRDINVAIPYNTTLIGYNGKNVSVYGKLSKPWLVQTAS
ncbi:hypothetical protein J4209_06880 [Candidatus Woesearchaeota archaeon]|nr:hypothetical protein [Candidatus Woesearchaeota archaeon]